MVTEIGTILLSHLDNMSWLDKYAGIVRTGTKASAGGGITRFPISCDVTAGDCEAGSYVDLVPDTRKQSIFYMEDLTGAQVVNTSNTRTDWRATIRLVAWYNVRKLNLNDDCNASALLIGDVMSRLPKGYSNSGDYQRINYRVVNQQIKDSRIFSRYTYDETQTQYLLKPFDFFALDVEVLFSTRIECLTPVVLGTPDPCDTK